MILGLGLGASSAFDLTFKCTIGCFLPASELSTEVFSALDFGILKCTIRLLVLAFVPELEGLAELFSALDFGRILGRVLAFRSDLEMFAWAIDVGCGGV
jgi:hypothetical protein